MWPLLEAVVDVQKYIQGLQSAIDNSTLGMAVGFMVFVVPAILFFVEAAREAIPGFRLTSMFGALLTFGLCILIFLFLTSFGCYIMRDLPSSNFINGMRTYCIVIPFGGG